MADNTGNNSGFGGPSSGGGDQPAPAAQPSNQIPPRPSGTNLRNPGQQVPPQAPRNASPAREERTTKLVVKGGVDPQTIRELNDSLKLLAQMNKEHTTSSKEMNESVREMTKSLAAMAGSADFGARRFRTMQETVQAVVVELDEVKDQYSGLIKLQKSIAAAPELLLGKNKNESLRFLDQAIKKTKELQRSRELDARSLTQLDKTLKALEKTYHAVEVAKEDAFQAGSADEMTKALLEANDAAAKLRKTFENTETTGILRGVQRVQKALGTLDETFDSRFSKMFKESPLGDLTKKIQGNWGKEARENRKRLRADTKAEWDNWKTERKARKNPPKPDTLVAPKPAAPLPPGKRPLAMPTSRHAGKKFTAPGWSAGRKGLTAASGGPAPVSGGQAGAHGGGSVPTTIQQVTIRQATITNLKTEMGATGGLKAAEDTQKAQTNAQIEHEKKTDPHAKDQGKDQGKEEETKTEPQIKKKNLSKKERKELERAQRMEEQKTPRQRKDELRRATKASTKAAGKAGGSVDSVATTAAADVAAEAVGTATGVSGAPLPTGRKTVTMGRTKAALLQKGLGTLASKALPAAAGEGGLMAAAGGAVGGAGGGLLKGAGALMGRVGGLVAAPLAIAKTILDISDMVKEQNKEMNSKLAGGGINASGVDFPGVRQSLLSSGVSNAATRGIGYKDNLETMQMLAQGGYGLGFLTKTQGRQTTNLESALMTRQEAEIGRDQFQGGGINGMFAALGRAGSLGNSAKAGDDDQNKRLRDSTGFVGAMMKNANFYGKNVGMEKGDSIKLTLTLLEKYKMTTEQTGDFFIKIDKAMRTAQISASKYVEIVESINSGFGDFNNTMKLTTNLLDIMGKNARFTGDRLKAITGEMFKGPKQDLAHRAFTFQESMRDEGTRRSTIDMHEQMGEKAQADLVEQAQNYGKFFADTKGVQRDEGGRITGITDLPAFEARLAELTREGGALQNDPTTKILQEQIMKTSRAVAYSRAQVDNLKRGDSVGYAAVQQNFGETPESAFAGNIDLMKALVRNTKGLKLTDLASRDPNVKGDAMKRSAAQQALLAEQLGMPMEELTKKIEAMTTIRSQVMDNIFEKLGKVSEDGKAPSDGSVSPRQMAAMAAMGRRLGIVGQGASDTDALKALQRMAKDPIKGGDLRRMMENSEGFITDLGGSLGVFADSINRDKESKAAKAKADEISSATRASADIFADAFTFLFQKLVEKLDWLGSVLDYKNWFKSKNKQGDYADKAETAESKKADAYGSAARAEAGRFIEPIRGKQSNLSDEARGWYATIQEISGKSGALTQAENDALNKALAQLREYLKKDGNAAKFGMKPQDLDAAVAKVYTEGQKAQDNLPSVEADERRAERLRKAAATGKAYRAGGIFAGATTLEGTTDELLQGEQHKTFREHQAAFAAFRNSEAGKNMDEATAKQVYARRFLSSRVLLQGVDKAQYSGQDATDTEAMIQQRLQEESLQRFFGKGDGKGGYSFTAGSLQDSMMSQMLDDMKAKGLFSGATKVTKDGNTYFNFNANPVVNNNAGNPTPTQAQETARNLKPAEGGGGAPASKG